MEGDGLSANSQPYFELCYSTLYHPTMLWRAIGSVRAAVLLCRNQGTKGKTQRCLSRRSDVSRLLV